MLRMRKLLLVSALLAPGAVHAAADPAQPAPAIPSEHRLSPDEIEKVLADAARKREHPGSAVDMAEPVAENLPQPIHGEVGFAIGTDGHRSAFGTAIVPLPGDGAAILSFGTDRFNTDFYRFER